MATLLASSTYAVQTKTTYTMDEIFNKMCIQCHSSDGSGNTDKLTPSMRDMTQAEIEEELVNVEEEKGHIIMEHNHEKINEMGMKYKAKDMAEYMYQRFHPTKKEK
jgi:cytochrome c553